MSRLGEGRPINLTLLTESCAPSSAASEHESEYFFIDQYVIADHNRPRGPENYQLAVLTERAASPSAANDAATLAAPPSDAPPTPAQGVDRRAQ